MRTDIVSGDHDVPTMDKSNYSAINNSSDVPMNRHERRAQAAINRPRIKKLKKYNASLRGMFNKLGVDPNGVENWDENKIKEFKEEVNNLKEAIEPLNNINKE